MIFLNRPPGDKIEGIDKNSLFGNVHDFIFACSNLSWKRYLHSIRITGQKPTVQNLFDATQTLIREQELEISGVSELSWCSSKCEELHLASDKEVIQLMKAKVYAFSDSVLCVGK